MTAKDLLQALQLRKKERKKGIQEVYKKLEKEVQNLSEKEEETLLKTL
jgi:hypothetical protein